MKATHNPPTDVQVTPADLLRMAALYLRRHGWHQGTYYAPINTPTPPACAAGAISMACAGRTVDHFLDIDADDRRLYLDAQAAFVDYLDVHEPVFHIDEDGFVIDQQAQPYAWNDDPNRTADQVITALEAAADEWDRLHTEGGEQ